MDKKALCAQIGDFFGDFFVENNQLCVDNGENVFRYDSPDDLLVDWVDTLVESHHDIDDDPKSSGKNIHNGWEKEIVFIYSEVIGKFPVGVSCISSHDNRKRWQSYADVGNGRHRKNFYLGTYFSIVDAIFARREFLARTGARDKNSQFNLEEAKLLAQEIQKLAKEWRQMEQLNHQAEKDADRNVLKIDLGFATLVAEKGADPHYNEVFIGLEDKNGVWLQDLALVGQKYHYDDSVKAINIEWDVDCDEDRANLPTQIIVPEGLKDEEEISDYLSEVTGFCHSGYVLVDNNVVQEKAVRVLVYGDKDQEDYTNEFLIDVYEDNNEISDSKSVMKPLDVQMNAAKEQCSQTRGSKSISSEREI